MNERTSIFAKPTEPQKLDVSDFKPDQTPRKRPNPAAIDSVSGFQSREVPPVPVETPKRSPFVYRTGRNVVISIKTTQAAVDAFYALAEQQGWKVGETFEHAISALIEKTSAGG